MEYSYIPKGVCSRKINLTIEDGVIADLSFEGGCSGNLQGISLLVKGRRAEDVAHLLEGTVCEGMGSSCPAQLSLAIRDALEKEQKEKGDRA